MRTSLLSILLLLLSFSLFSQQGNKTSIPISDCRGAISMHESGEFTLQFTGKGGSVQDIHTYSELSKINPSNTIYCIYTAEKNGRLSISAKSQVKFQLVVFQSDSADLCNEIINGRADVVRVFKTPTNQVGLNLILGPEIQFPLNLKAGQQLIFGFFGEAKKTDFLSLKTTFEVFDAKFQDLNEKSKFVDLREDEFQPGLTVKLRDQETGNPVIANITIQGIKSLTAIYNGSDFKFPVVRSGKIHIEVDAEGYFFVDRDEPITFNSENEIVIWLTPLGNGKSQKIDQIEFYPGSSEFLKTALPKLNRLKNFLALNAYVNIEIQGHVHSNNPINTVDGQRLSEARAKRIYNFLIESGIDKSRLTTVGYGNTQPVFPNAQLPSEEQANRRVEIKVK
jgi:outer membrane protein OmpA-like peptidoglycan-associated protein